MDHARAIELRPGDAMEIESLGMTKEEALSRSLARSVWANAYLIDGEVGALVGVLYTSLIGGEPMPWLMTGVPVERHRKAFMAITRTETRAMLQRYGALTCYVHADYARSIRWMRWLGFDLAPAQPIGPQGAPFHRATLRAT